MEYKQSSVYKLWSRNNIKLAVDSVIILTNSSWNDCIDTGRSTDGYVSFNQSGPSVYGSHLPVSFAMSNGEAEYISTTVACMTASFLRMSIYNLRYIEGDEYDHDSVRMKSVRIFIDIEAAISMAKCNNDTAGNRHVARHHYIWQRTAL